MAETWAKVVCSDCLEALAGLDEACADLVYLDPPYNTGRPQRGRAASYQDCWASTEDYVAFLRPRVEACRRILRPTGSILLHCDWRACHHLRLMLDEIFGEGSFVNHLIWSYGLGGSSPRRFARKHDDILFYAKSDAYHFDPPRVPATSRRMQGQMKKASDVISIPAINNMSAERTGYPTQKPVALLKVLITACSPAGGFVVDPFCGSGTTLVAAVESGRRVLGIDVSPDAVAIASKRLDSLVTGRDAVRAPGPGASKARRSSQKPPLRMRSRLSGKG